MKRKVIASFIFMMVGFGAHDSYAQDLDINLNPQQPVILDKTNGTLEVKICNCHTANMAAANDKPRPLISFPDNLTIQSITNIDGSILTGFSVQSLTNDPGNHTVRLLMNSTLANASCTSFLIKVKGSGVGTGAITATLGFLGTQTPDNLTANDNALATIPVEVNFPVELTEFRVKKDERTAILEWATTEEVNASHFDVQRSRDGQSWQTITSVMAKGNSKARIVYEARDCDPLNGDNLYRLHMIDADGSSAYSVIRRLKFEFESLLVFPNPAKDVLHIRSTNWNKIQHITIRDVKGQQVYRSIDNPTTQINLTRFAAGIYIVEVVMNSGEAHTTRIAIAN